MAKRSPAPRGENDERDSHRAPSKRNPAPSKRAPAPSKRAPAPSKRADAGLAKRAIDAVERMSSAAEGFINAFKTRWSWAVGRTEADKREAANGSRVEMVAKAVEEREALYAGDD